MDIRGYAIASVRKVARTRVWAVAAAMIFLYVMHVPGTAQEFYAGQLGIGVGLHLSTTVTYLDLVGAFDGGLASQYVTLCFSPRLLVGFGTRIRLSPALLYQREEEPYMGVSYPLVDFGFYLPEPTGLGSPYPQIYVKLGASLKPMQGWETASAHVEVSFYGMVVYSHPAKWELMIGQEVLLFIYAGR